MAAVPRQQATSAGHVIRPYQRHVSRQLCHVSSCSVPYQQPLSVTSAVPQHMPMLTRSQTGDMEQKQGETTEAYEARMLTLMAEIKQRADAATAAWKKEEDEAEKPRCLVEEHRQKQDEAAAKAADEERIQRCNKIFKEESALLALAAEWQTEAKGGEISNSGIKLSLLLSLFTDLLATCIAQQEDIHCLNHAVHDHKQTVTQLTSRIQLLEQQQCTATPDAGPSNLAVRVNVLEVAVGMLKDGAQQQQATNQQLEQQICAAAAGPTSSPHERIPKFDGLPIFCDATKTEPIPWWRQFELILDIHKTCDPSRHVYLYHWSGGACQAWLDNMLSTHKVKIFELHTKISWKDLKAAWHRRLQVEPPEFQAMNKLGKFYQNTLPSVDWIIEYQHLASTPDLPLAFKGIKHLFIKRSCPALQNALMQVAETLTTSEELFNKASQIIVTNMEARNAGRSSSAGQGRDQHRPKVAVVAATMPTNPSNKAAPSNEGERLAAARDSGRPIKGRGRGKSKTNTASSTGPGQAAQEPWSHYGLSKGAYKVRMRYRYCLWCNGVLHGTVSCPDKAK
ncbi:hypothetical protein CBR_g51487 [Chara braunii]|uniref:Uncharacterized protein n=1 Tax=Chara braunii TaxID=69332 RepID=A0A388K6C4_CHABU|nr:hypothetical protein CBR_g51487 [Chara braunii]|eukprot:GBG65604.1 hypothetical protein CBR_g51487 [Chara braunii]